MSRLPFALHPFRPRLLDHLRGYSRTDFLHDLGAGLTVGVVALPLAMAFAIASGVKPEQGIFTAIVAGFLISALGGSSVQIGGPAGAFIVIVYGIVQRHGLTNLLISTALAGVLLFAMGALKLGALVRYMPVPIIIGFTNGIAVLIALSQLRDLFGLRIDKMPGDFFSQIHALATHADSFNPYALGIGLACAAGLFLWPRLFSPGGVLADSALEGITLRTAARMPGPIVALVTLTLIAAALQLPVETIGSRFGGIPQGLPSLALPPFTWDGARQLFIPTLTIALLGAVESLLCARVADNLVTTPRHDPNQELMAQGIANMVVPAFGGIPATGTIARTVTNVRAGARTPVAGIVHALTLLAVVLAAAPLAEYVPLPALAGILLFVAWNMGEWREFARLRHFSVPYRTILVGTFLLTVIFDLTVAVEVGIVLACVFFIYRMSTLFRVEPAESPAPDVRVCRLYGALFFGAVAKMEAVAEALPPGTRAVVLEMHRLVLMDTSGLHALEQLQRSLERQEVRLVLCELNEQPLGLIQRAGFEAQLGAQNVTADLASAIRRAAESDPTSRTASPA
ncbi:MAG TPA: SulP family inorganic anion transporter [Albitalea sp.]|uniref:SulP family inorganic anion transporter n=1 Tax=Piscinibacter sp. TaxID=1903157 RepID=UPI002ED1AE72